MLCLIDQAVKLRDSPLIITAFHEGDAVLPALLHLTGHMAAAGEEEQHTG